MLTTLKLSCGMSLVLENEIELGTLLGLIIDEAAGG
jgi:hypothetical protein